MNLFGPAASKIGGLGQNLANDYALNLRPLLSVVVRFGGEVLSARLWLLN